MLEDQICNIYDTSLIIGDMVVVVLAKRIYSYEFVLQIVYMIFVYCLFDTAVIICTKIKNPDSLSGHLFNIGVRHFNLILHKMSILMTTTWQV